MVRKKIHSVEKILTDIIKTIKDPEEPETLEELNMVSEDLIYVKSN